jgi:hypothetical protein
MAKVEEGCFSGSSFRCPYVSKPLRRRSELSLEWFFCLILKRWDVEVFLGFWLICRSIMLPHNCALLSLRHGAQLVLAEFYWLATRILPPSK